jgi:hypothetical protein
VVLKEESRLAWTLALEALVAWLWTLARDAARATPTQKLRRPLGEIKAALRPPADRRIIRHLGTRLGAGLFVSADVGKSIPDASLDCGRARRCARMGHAGVGHLANGKSAQH